MSKWLKFALIACAANGISALYGRILQGWGLNQGYRLQYQESLNTTKWTDVAPDVVATGPTTAMTNTTGNSVRRFYRVALVP